MKRNISCVYIVKNVSGCHALSFSAGLFLLALKLNWEKNKLQKKMIRLETVFSK